VSRSVKVRNAQGVREAIEKYGEAVENGVSRLVTAAGLEAITDVKKRIQSPPKTGEIYRRGSISHQASKDGEAPATDTGTLVNSIFFEQKNKLQVKIGSRLPYAFYLENGTMMMRPRPSWKHAVFTARKKLNDNIDKLLKALNK
jgi:hypothetical protein